MSEIFIGFFTGVIFTMQMVAALFFLKFWRDTKDVLFLAFAAAFLIEALNRLRFLFIEHPNEGNPSIYLVRLLAFMLIVAAILYKNRRQ